MSICNPGLRVELANQQMRPLQLEHAALTKFAAQPSCLGRICNILCVKMLVTSYAGLGAGAVSSSSHA